MRSAGFRRSTASITRSRQVSASRYNGACSSDKPLTPHLDLVFGFLTRAVEHRPDHRGEMCSGLQEQRRLADARFAADQHERTGDQPSTQHAIELADPGAPAIGDHRIDVCIQPRLAATERTWSGRRAARWQHSPRQTYSTRRSQGIGPAISARRFRRTDRRRGGRASWQVGSEKPEVRSENRLSRGARTLTLALGLQTRTLAMPVLESFQHRSFRFALEILKLHRKLLAQLQRASARRHSDVPCRNCHWCQSRRSEICVLATGSGRQVRHRPSGRAGVPLLAAPDRIRPARTRDADEPCSSKTAIS